MLRKRANTVRWWPNGSGKSTLLRSLAGLNLAQGALWLDDGDLMQMLLARRAEKAGTYAVAACRVRLHVLVDHRAQRAPPGGRSNAGSEAEVMVLRNRLGTPIWR